MRRMGSLFLVLTFLAGVTVGTVEVALINVVVFLGLALLAVRLLEPRYGSNGLAFGMAGAFFLSFLWPVVVYAVQADGECAGADCPIEPRVTVTLEPVT